MKEKRSLLNMIFGNKKQTNTVTKTEMQLLSGYDAKFTTISSNIYDSKVSRQCIDRIATHCAKLIPKHIQGSIGNNIKGEINFLLQNEPNPIMNTYDSNSNTVPSAHCTTVAATAAKTATCTDYVLLAKSYLN